MSSAKWRLFCLGLNVLKETILQMAPGARPTVVTMKTKFESKKCKG